MSACGSSALLNGNKDLSEARFVVKKIKKRLGDVTDER
jgi:isochorismate synthase EntC